MRPVRLIVDVSGVTAQEPGVPSGGPDNVVDDVWLAEPQNSSVVSFHIHSLHLRRVTRGMAEVTADGGSSSSSVISSITGEH